MRFLRFFFLCIVFSDCFSVTSQRDPVKLYLYFSVLSSLIWGNWIWVTMTYRILEWSSCLMDWIILFASWKDWGQLDFDCCFNFSSKANFRSYYTGICWVTWNSYICKKKISLESHSWKSLIEFLYNVHINNFLYPNRWLNLLLKSVNIWIIQIIQWIGKKYSFLLPKKYFLLWLFKKKSKAAIDDNKFLLY